MIAAELTMKYMNPVLNYFHIEIYPEEGFGIPHVTLNMDRLAIAVSTLLSALIGAYVPARNASRMDPVECLRND